MLVFVSCGDGDLRAESAVRVGCPTEGCAGYGKAHGDMGCWGFDESGDAHGDGYAVEWDRREQRARQLLYFSFCIDGLIVRQGVVAVAGLYFEIRPVDDGDPDLAEFAVKVLGGG